MSKLDLSSREAMLKGGEKGPAIVPGNAEASPLIRRISGLQAPAMPMPPVPALNAQEVELVKNWINQGAKMTAVAADCCGHRHGWRFSAIPVDTLLARSRIRTGHGGRLRSRSQSAPTVRDAKLSHNPIDAFVANMREQKGLEGAPEADRRTLIRRAYLDLIGLLPPTRKSTLL